MTDPTDTDQTKLLYPKLSYTLRGMFFTIANAYGLGHKEKLYHQALNDELTTKNIPFDHEKQIPIYSWRDGRTISRYIPDFIIQNQIVVEFKSEPFLTEKFYTQTYSYLRVTRYELAFVVNFGADELQIRRLLFTNDRKPSLVKSVPA